MKSSNFHENTSYFNNDENNMSDDDAEEDKIMVQMIEKNIDTKDDLDLAVRLKCIEEGYHLKVRKLDPDRKNPWTVTRIKTNGEGVLEMLFIVIGVSDLTTRFLAQFFPPGRTAKLRNDNLMFQQHQVQIFYDYVYPVTRPTIDQADRGKLCDKNAKESWALLGDPTLVDNESWNDPRDFAKPVKAISLPQDVSSTSDRRLIELENQVQRLMEACWDLLI
ncbi:hypothetical protein Tco_0847935 [Tanacetum coccineum]